MKKSLVGAILFSLIGSMPYVILYVYFNIPWAFLSYLIGVSTFIGYRLFKGKVNKESKNLILFISIMATLIVTLLIIPSLLVINKNMGSVTSVLPLLYKNYDFLIRLFRDLLIGLLFVTCSVYTIYKRVNNSSNSTFKEEKEVTSVKRSKKKK